MLPALPFEPAVPEPLAPPFAGLPPELLDAPPLPEPPDEPIFPPLPAPPLDAPPAPEAPDEPEPLSPQAGASANNESSPKRLRNRPSASSFHSSTVAVVPGRSAQARPTKSSPRVGGGARHPLLARPALEVANQRL